MFVVGGVGVRLRFAAAASVERRPQFLHSHSVGLVLFIVEEDGLSRDSWCCGWA